MMGSSLGRRLLCGGILIAALMHSRSLNAEENVSLTAAQLKAFDTKVLAVDEGNAARWDRMLSDDARARLREANRRESTAWRGIKSKAQWEAYREERIASLRNSLGPFPAAPNPLPVKITQERRGNGYRVENILFESRPGLWVTANLYRPEKPGESMPGILICHSHHNPKTQTELQDMGVMWARAGCLVLVIDQLGHGERRQHPFASESDFEGLFRLGRQDYFFRYNVGLELSLVGESLIGWMAWDLMRGVDLLLTRPGIDPKRILLLGAVAGGSDPAAVTAAIDPRIAAVVPFNFGGPQPETGRLGDDAEEAFNYAGSGSWESTRNMPFSARDGFLPWVIVGSTAPRGLVYAHEFRWDQEHDPVWKRLQTIYGFYYASDRLAFVHGFGTVTMSSGDASHCNNIGPVHRKGIHESFYKWFQIPQPDEQFRERRMPSELHCLEGAQGQSVKLTPVHQLAKQIAEERLAKTRDKLRQAAPATERKLLRKLWAEKLGEISPYEPKVSCQEVQALGGVRIEKLVMSGEREIRIPLLLLHPSNPSEGKFPLTVFVAQAGKDHLLKDRAEAIAELLKNGVAVGLADLRGMGETQPGSGRSRQSGATSLSATELMLGQTLLGSRLKDLRSILVYLRSREDIDSRRVAVWGDSLAPMNGPDQNVAVPHGIDDMPHQAEPGGPLLALFAGLYEDDLAAVVLARGGLVGWQSVLESPFLYLPHDAVIPAALTVCDVEDLVFALAPKPVWISGLVDGRNRRASQNDVDRMSANVRTRYESLNASQKLKLTPNEQDPAREIAPWLLGTLQP